MADIDSSETFGNQNSNDGFSNQNFKNFGQSVAPVNFPPPLPQPNSEASTMESSTGDDAGDIAAPHESEPTKAEPELVVPPLLADHQFKEILAFPQNFFEYAVRSFFPGILPDAKDSAEEKAQKEQTWARIMSYDQEMKEVFLSKSQAWKERQKQEQQAAQVRQEALAQQQSDQESFMPTGKQSGAQTIMGSTKAKTKALHQQLKTSNSDRTQSGD